jgi:hypothetical protein
MTRFFTDQVASRARLAEARDELRVVIVLSAPAFLGRQAPVESVKYERDPNRKVFYLRYRPLPNPFSDQGQAALANTLPSDDLEHVLKLFDARVYTANTPEDFRKALSNMLAAIRTM